MKKAILMALAGWLLPAWGQNPYLSFSPNPVELTVEAGTAAAVSTKVQMTNTGNPFSFSVTSNQGWLTVSPASGTIGTGVTLELTITGDPAQIQTGLYSGVVTITPAGTSGLPAATFTVNFRMNGIAILSSPDKLDFAIGPESTDVKALNLTISDGVMRTVAVTTVTADGGNWLSVVSAPPFTAPLSVNIRANTSGLEVGTMLTGEVRITSPSLAGIMKTIPVTLLVLDQSTGYTVAPSQLNFYAFGTQQPPPQFVQVTAAGGRSAQFDVLLSPGSAGLMASANRAITPATFSVQMDTSQTIQLPREDSLTVRPADGAADMLIPVKTRLAPFPAIYSIPQVADGGPASAGKFKTSITVTNNDTVPAIVSLKFYKSDPATRGSAPWFPQIENNEKTDNITIPVNASWTIQTAGAPDAISSGWAEVVCSTCVGNSKGVSGLAVFRQLQPDGRIQEAAVPVNSTLMQRSLLPFDNTNGFVTSMAIANLSATETARVRVAFRDSLGRLLRVDKLKDIPPRGHSAFELAREFPAVQGLRGTADFWILDGQISVLGLRFSPSGAFTSFETQSLNRRVQGRRSIPQVADGGEFRTAITLVNNDAATANVRLRFWQDDGTAGATKPWTVAFTTGENPDNLTIAPGTSITLETNGASPTVQQGWAEVVTEQWVTGFAVFRQSVAGRSAQEAAVPVNVSTPLRYLLPFDNSGGFTTSMAIANLSDFVAAQVNFTFRDNQGQRLLQAALPDLPVRGHRAFRLVDLWPDLEGKRGTLEVSSLSGEVTVLGLRFSSGGAFTSFKGQPVQ